MSPIQKWLKLAPKPERLDGKLQWHVFLSYRSVHRPWTIQLYDVLRQLGYRVFVDQFVLAPSDILVTKLQEGLTLSRAGILVWSSANEDSAWCKREYENMETRRIQDPSFHYVAIRLDDGELPAFAADRVYVDFTGSREGPHGSGLLRLLHGINGRPLPESAVRFATQVDSETRTALNKIRAARHIGDHDGLVKLARSTSLPWMTSALLGCATAEALISLRKDSAEALVLLDQLQQRFPLTIRVRQLRGLALARAGKVTEAQTVLGELKAAGESDPETLGIYARTWMDRYALSNDPLHLKASRDLYAQAFAGAPKNYYTGINAAAKSVFLGDMPAALRYASQVQKIVGTSAVVDDYWKTATVAEAQLILGNSTAADLYAAALAIAPNETASHESTWKQACRLMEHLRPKPADRLKLEKTFSHLIRPVTAKKPYVRRVRAGSPVRLAGSRVRNAFPTKKSARAT